jgi:SH3-like domain-containing protein
MYLSLIKFRANVTGVRAKKTLPCFNFNCQQRRRNVCEPNLLQIFGKDYQNHLIMKKHFQLSVRLSSLLVAICLGVGGGFGPISTPSSAQEAKLTVRGSGLPVPRFVTLKFNEVNMRAGPGREYPVLWGYSKTGLPLLVEAEFGLWRKVVDHEGTTGWMRGSVLSLRRMALVTTGSAKIHRDSTSQSTIIAVAEKNSLLELQSCPKTMCKVAKDDIRGWIERDAIWGILTSEILN